MKAFNLLPSKNVILLGLALLGGLWGASGCTSTQVVMGAGKPWDLQNESWVAVEVTASSSRQSVAGVQCLDMGEYRQAAECLEAAVAENPEDHQSHFALGVAYEAAGDKVKPRENYNTAVRLAPTEMKYRRQMAHLGDEVASESVASAH